MTHATTSECSVSQHTSTFNTILYILPIDILIENVLPSLRFGGQSQVLYRIHPTVSLQRNGCVALGAESRAGYALFERSDRKTEEFYTQTYLPTRSIYRTIGCHSIITRRSRHSLGCHLLLRSGSRWTCGCPTVVARA
jgi:hypothetical protein